MAVILWQKINGPTWESGYIKRDLLQNDYSEIVLFDKEDFKNYDKWTLVKYKNCIIVFGPSANRYIKPYLEGLKPRIIIYTSDEAGKYADFLDYPKHTNLFLHNYRHKYKYPDNAVQVPLGYVNDLINCNDSIRLIDNYLDENKDDISIPIKPQAERIYNFSFIGDASKNEERKKIYTMLEEMGPFLGRENRLESNSTPWGDVRKVAVSPPEMYDIYNNTIFVFAGRGNYSLDAFRIYESIMAGAIPIIIGGDDEINITFGYNGNLLKALYFPSIEKAMSKCKKMLEDPDKLQETQHEVLNWWKSNMQRIRGRIAEAMALPAITAITAKPAKPVWKARRGGGESDYPMIIYCIILACLISIIIIYLLEENAISDKKINCNYNL